MTSNRSEHKTKFFKLVEQLETKIVDLRQEVSELRSENRNLRKQLKKLHKGQTDIFSAITEKDRIALKQQIQEFIETIDQHLDKTGDQLENPENEEEKEEQEAE